jgi:hemerythrin
MWSEEFSVNHPQLDRQHQKLFFLLDLVQNANPAIHNVHHILNELMEYSKNHFKFEESYMREIHFEFIDEHIQMHDHYLDTVTQMCLHALDDNLEYKTLKEFLSNWWNHHILYEDKRYANLTVSKSIEIKAFRVK